ncbi:MAG: MBL fold metallo-hydrolase [Pseudomonadota bacterium]
MENNEILKLSEHIYFVLGENKGRFPSCHGLLLVGGETVLIDAGIGEHQIREIDRKRRIDVLIITHSHPDHIRHWHVLGDRVIMMPRETPEAVTDLDRLGERFMESKELAEEWVRWIEDFGVRALREPDRRYADGDILDLAGCRLEAIRTPGHLGDHYCFFERTTGTLFTTDIDLTAFGPWYGNPEADIGTFRRDVKRVMALPYERVCSSHKEPVEGDATSLFEAFLEAFSRQSRAVLDLCGPDASLRDITAAMPIYRKRLPNKVLHEAFETVMVKKILDTLIRDGLVEELHGRYIRTDGRSADRC